MSKAVYAALRYGEAAPWEYWRWRIARETGWALAYIDGLSLADIREYWQVVDGEGRARKASAEQAARAGGRPGRKR